MIALDANVAVCAMLAVSAEHFERGYVLWVAVPVVVLCADLAFRDGFVASASALPSLATVAALVPVLALSICGIVGVTRSEALR